MTDKRDDAAADLLIREVDEDLRRDRLNSLWKRHGSAVIGGAVALVLSVAAWQAWNAWDLRQRRDSSARLDAATTLVEQGKADQAAEGLTQLSQDGTRGYRLLARLRLADLRQQQGDLPEAIRLYRALAEDGAADGAYRDMARIRLGYLELDSADPTALEAQIAPLAVESSPWRHSAREIQALLALRKGESGRAADLFARLAEDTAAPRDLRGRAAEMLAATGRPDRG